jgi:hypothetical protein
MSSPAWTAGVKPDTPTLDLPDKLQNAQATYVRHHYVRSQLRDLNRRGDAVMRDTLTALIEDNIWPQAAEAKKLLKKKTEKLQELLEKTWAHLNSRLQTADLTINFEASKWFTTPNNYDSYSQMYERAVRTVTAADGSTFKGFRITGDTLNPADIRAKADDTVTFSKGMLNRGKINSAFGTARVMSPGGLAQPAVDAKDGEFEAVNPFFNPKSKQVFAALNYGRRPHGSITTYGQSYMVLNPKFKTNAIYFPGDTFLASKNLMSFNNQVSYGYLGAVYLHGQTMMKQNIVKSCLQDQELPDDSCVFDLLEAHLFEPLTFTGNLEALCVSLDGLDGTVLTAVQTNARAFGKKHGADVFFI